MSLRDVLIIGAGPSGLATAIALKKRGINHLVIEKGGLVDGIARMPTNMVFFTTPELLEIGGIPLTTPYEKPTRQEALQYYRKVTDAFQLDLVLHEEVVGVAHEDPPRESAADASPPVPSERGSAGVEAGVFVVESRSRLGETRARHARAVVLAMGYYGCPNLLDVPGESLPHVSHYYGEAHAYYRRRVVVVGGRNSSCEAALELYRSGAQVTLVHRGPKLADSVKYWVKPDIENRIREGSIAALFNTRIVEIRPTEVVVESAAQRRLWSRGEEERQTIPADAVLLLTGYHADPGFLRRAGIDVSDETLVPRHDQLTFETNVPNLFIAGGQLAGRRTGTVFIENGRFHGERIAEVIGERLKNRRS